MEKDLLAEVEKESTGVIPKEGFYSRSLLIFI
jgi:hypothetical protein